jgi:hypothetical protein
VVEKPAIISDDCAVAIVLQRHVIGELGQIWA